MKRLLLLLLMLGIVVLPMALVGPTFAQTDPATIQRAANGVSHLPSMMKDPDSFVLDTAYLKKPNKQGVSEVCYYYRAHNSYGGYSGQGEAVLLKNDTIFIVDAETQANPFFGLADPCRTKNRVANIPADLLSVLNPSQTRSAQIKSRADRKKMIEAENAGFKKKGVAGYAEIVEDSYIVHSERAQTLYGSMRTCWGTRSTWKPCRGLRLRPSSIRTTPIRNSCMT